MDKPPQPLPDWSALLAERDAEITRLTAEVELLKDETRAAIAIVLEEAAQIAEPQVDDYSIEYHIRNDIADAIREMIPSGTTPAQDDNANSK